MQDEKPAVFLQQEMQTIFISNWRISLHIGAPPTVFKCFLYLNAKMLKYLLHISEIIIICNLLSDDLLSYNIWETTDICNILKELNDSYTFHCHTVVY